MQTGRAYGKLILAGEHAVVYGVPAIAVGIVRGSRAVARPASPARADSDARPASNVNELRIAAWSVDVREGGDGDLARAFTALLASARSRNAFSPMQVDASTALPAGGGLGCSAALGVAVARAISPDGSDEDVLADAMAWEKVFHGNPSGVDAAVATRGGAIQFVRGAGIESLESGSLVFAIGHSGNASSTKTMVEGLARLREAEPAMVGAAFERIRTIARDARGAIESGDLAALGDAMADNQEILAKLALSTPDIDAMCAVARNRGALGCKLTGAGGGGCVVALAEDRASAERVVEAWRENRKDGFVTELGAPHHEKNSRGLAPAKDSVTAI
ncbi:MAG TPA: mevalonate kinase [Polyangiaceae bacterium]